MHLLSRTGMLPKETPKEDDIVGAPVKIFYCSRTHSQLSQFSGEVRKVHVPPPYSSAEDGGASPLATTELEESVKLLSLSSRKHTCIHEGVRKLGTIGAVNDRCMELQQSKTPKDQKCPYLPKKEDQVLVEQFRDQALAEVRDIEDLGRLGRKH
jgi:chromosome transmission fidelity protein 1